MAMPPNRVSDLRFMFTTRHHPGCDVQLAWAHFDLSIVADIMRQIEQDRNSPIQFLRRDQAGLIHMLRSVREWKDVCREQRIGQISAVAYRQRSYFPQVHVLLNGLQRNSFILPLVEKECDRHSGTEPAQVAIDPTPIDPTPIDPTPIDPTPIDPTPIAPSAKRKRDVDNQRAVYSANGGSRHWNASEDAQVALYIADRSSRNDVLSKLPGRTAHALMKRAKRLKTKTSQ